MNTRKRFYVLTVTVVVALFLGALWFEKSSPEKSSQPLASNVTNSIVSVPSTPITNLQSTINFAPANVSNTDLMVSTNLADTYKAYQQGQISKDKMIAAIWQAENKTPQEFFGKVIDQYGQPVVGASVNGDLMLIQGADVGEKKEVYKTQTDANGEFEFTGLHGWELAIAPSKAGYELAPNITAMQLPSAGKTSPFERAIFTMWKLRGAEPMIHVKAQAGIACDGSLTSLDLLTGKKIANGDLIVKLIRNPVDIVRGKPFDWSITIEIPSGGLQEIKDLYPNEAPTDGYQPSITIDFPADMPKWTAWLDRSFYFKGRDGQIYGRMSISVTADFQPPPTFFSADIYANSTGSRNLEFDPAKQIR
jgi:hypothetical protein